MPPYSTRDRQAHVTATRASKPWVPARRRWPISSGRLETNCATCAPSGLTVFRAGPGVARTLGEFPWHPAQLDLMDGGVRPPVQAGRAASAIGM